MNWPIVSLEKLVEKIDYGLTASAVENRDGPRFLRITDLQNDSVNWASVPSCECSEEDTNKYQLEPGDIVFARTGATTGKSYLITELPATTVFASYLIRVRTKKDVSPSYLSCFLKSPRYWLQISSMANGAAQPGVNSTKLKELKIPLPPLPQQKRIAAILDKAAAIRRKRQQAIQLVDEFLRSVFLDMFGDPITNPKQWQTQKLSEAGELARGKSKHRPRNDPILLGGPYPLIQTDDVANANHFIKTHTRTYSEIGLQQSKLWPRGTLCITIAANIADTAILTYEACFPDSVVGFIPSESTRTEYIHMWLQFYQRILKDKAPESAQKNINLEILSKLTVPIPPRDLQDKFVAIFKGIEDIKIKMRDTEEGFMNTFNSVSQLAFRGAL